MKKEEKNDDLSVDGPGSPISLNKFLKSREKEQTQPLMALIDDTGAGIAKDSPNIMYITPEECSKQAIYYSKHVFNGVGIPLYLYRQIAYMYKIGKEYKTDKALLDDFYKGIITAESPDYKQIINLIKYCESNPEAQQVIGLIQLLAGTLSSAKKNNKIVPIYIEHPETSLHPAKQAALMTMLTDIMHEYEDIKKSENEK